MIARSSGKTSQLVLGGIILILHMEKNNFNFENACLFGKGHQSLHMYTLREFVKCCLLIHCIRLTTVHAEL